MSRLSEWRNALTNARSLEPQRTGGGFTISATENPDGIRIVLPDHPGGQTQAIVTLTDSQALDLTEMLGYFLLDEAADGSLRRHR